MPSPTPSIRPWPAATLTACQHILVERILEFCRQHRHGRPGVLVIEGEAGTGKSVVINTAFARLQALARSRQATDVLHGSRNLLLVNHPEMIKYYKRVAETLPAVRKGDYQRPTSFVNASHRNGQSADIIFIDEAHLLLSRPDRYNHFVQDNHLQEILALAQVVVLIFDQHQVLKFKSHWDRAQLAQQLQGHHVEYVQLTDQFRMQALPDVGAWIHAFRDGQLRPLPAQQRFEFRIYDDAQAMYQAIRAHDARVGLCRMLATYDYPYTLDGHDHFITEGRFHLRWDRSLPQARLAWAERPDTIDEVGSVYTVQGFDLNYAGVILGPSVSWDAASQRIRIDPARYQDRAAFSGQQGVAEPEQLRRSIMLNAISILLSRPILGLYLYASDPELRRQLASLRDQPHG